MKRGDIAILRQPGTFASKARPCLIVQADFSLPSRNVIVCPITSTLKDAPTIRVPLNPDSETGLRVRSEVEVDLLFTAHASFIDRIIGSASDGDMRLISDALRRWLDL